MHHIYSSRGSNSEACKKLWKGKKQMWQWNKSREIMEESKKCMILKGWVEMDDALSGRLKSESMWTILSQAPLKQSQHTQFMERVLLWEGGRGKQDGAGDGANKQAVVSAGAWSRGEFWSGSCTTELAHLQAKCWIFVPPLAVCSLPGRAATLWLWAISSQHSQQLWMVYHIPGKWDLGKAQKDPPNRVRVELKGKEWRKQREW